MASKRPPKKTVSPNDSSFLKIKPKTIHLNFTHRNNKQKELIESFNNNHIIFAIGVAGTGKTYCVATLALQSLLYGEVDKIIIARPIVEAGERLGFLPGDLRDKIDPYNAPIIDILKEHLNKEIFEQFVLDEKIQFIPLAFMRGRSFKNAIMILDESQNATIQQVHMFITRMDDGSKVLITGDQSQIDLPYNVTSGLMHSVNILKNIEGVGITEFNENEVQRHPMVSKVIAAYANEHLKISNESLKIGIVAQEKIEVEKPITDPRVPKSKKSNKKRAS